MGRGLLWRIHPARVGVALRDSSRRVGGIDEATMVAASSPPSLVYVDGCVGKNKAKRQ